MTQFIRQIKAGLLLSLPAAAFAVAPGITPTDGTVFHPTTGQEVTVWKLVGKAACSAVQIHPRWYLNSAHCYSHTVAFTNHLALSGTATAACIPHPSYGTTGPGSGQTSRNDIALCRLTSPVNTGVTFPPLVAAPTEIQPLTQPSSALSDTASRDALRPYLAKWGHVMAYGRGGTPGLAVVDFSGMPPQANPATGLPATSVPRNIDGDSGGALYWLSPTSSEAALVGILTSADASPRGTSYLTEETLSWIRTEMAKTGDTDLRTLTAAQHFTGITGPAVQELQRKPTIRSVDGVSRSNFTVRWESPTNSAPIDGYDLSLGNGAGTQERAWYVAQGQGNASTLSGITSGQKVLCARAKGASGQALPAYATNFLDIQVPAIVLTPNCVSFDTTSTTGTASNLTSSVESSATQRRLTFLWQTSAPGAAYHRIEQTLTYAPGIVRSSTAEVTSPTYVVSVAKGTKVCLKVTPLNDIGIAGTSASTCVTPL